MNALLCAFTFLLGATSLSEDFQSANAAYAAGKFAEATQAYEKIAAAGAVDPVLFFNLGNAYYKAGRLGPAIANFERAVALRPGFAEARENLEKAVSDTKNKLPKPLRPGWQQALLFWDSSLAYGTARGIAIGAWLAFWGLLGIHLLRRVPYGRSIALFLAGLAALSGLSAWCKAHPVPLAVGMPAQGSAQVRFGPADSEEVRFELAEGDRVAVEDHANGWVRVRSIDGVQGWVREGDVCLVGPPYAPATAVPTPGTSPKR